MAFDYFLFPYGSDNYGALIHDRKTDQTACIDAGDAAAYEEALLQKGWTLTQIWVTHHHGDHVAGLSTLKSGSGATAMGPAGIAGIDRQLADNDRFEFAETQVHVLHTPGHTLDMLNYHIPSEATVFTGDTLFTMGCGRLFEGSADQMWDSLQKLMALPPETSVYSSHEYTQANARFALSVDPDNTALKARQAEVDALRAKHQPTVPSRMDRELQTNPFLRAGDPAIRAHLGLQDASDAEVFAEIRARKDRF